MKKFHTIFIINLLHVKFTMYLYLCNDRCIIIYIQGTIILWCSVHTIKILVTYVNLKCISKAPQQST